MVLETYWDETNSNNFAALLAKYADNQEALYMAHPEIILAGLAALQTLGNDFTKRIASEVTEIIQSGGIGVGLYIPPEDGSDIPFETQDNEPLRFPFNDEIGTVMVGIVDKELNAHDASRRIYMLVPIGFVGAIVGMTSDNQHEVNVDAMETIAATALKIASLKYNLADFSDEEAAEEAILMVDSYKDKILLDLEYRFGEIDQYKCDQLELLFREVFSQNRSRLS